MTETLKDIIADMDKFIAAMPEGKKGWEVGVSMSDFRIIRERLFLFSKRKKKKVNK
jgi:hypothetical protein